MAERSRWTRYGRNGQVETYEEIVGLDVEVWISPRPNYCDRGNFLAQADVKPGGDALRLDLHAADGWPRYYMDLDRAKLEIEDWMKKRKQWVEK